MRLVRGRRAQRYLLGLDEAIEAKYPPPDLYPLQGALVGKTFCKYCTAPFPAELVACPHCGAPARDRAA